jgi:hypothetical protein
MVRVLKERVTIQPGGLVEVRSADLTPGLEAEVIVLVDQPSAVPEAAPSNLSSGWRQFAGAIDSGDVRASATERIDEDLAREYGSDGRDY